MTDLTEARIDALKALFDALPKNQGWPFTGPVAGLARAISEVNAGGRPAGELAAILEGVILGLPENYNDVVTALRGVVAVGRDVLLSESARYVAAQTDNVKDAIEVLAQAQINVRLPRVA